MTEETRTRKGKMSEWLPRLFPAYREMEKTLLAKDDALRLSESIIQTYRHDLAILRKKIESDTNLITSLNRHIGTLEGKAATQVELIQELRDRLNTLLAIPGNQKNN